MTDISMTTSATHTPETTSMNRAAITAINSTSMAKNTSATTTLITTTASIGGKWINNDNYTIRIRITRKKYFCSYSHLFFIVECCNHLEIKLTEIADSIDENYTHNITSRVIDTLTILRETHDGRVQYESEAENKTLWFSDNNWKVKWLICLISFLFIFMIHILKSCFSDQSPNFCW